VIEALIVKMTITRLPNPAYTHSADNSR